MTLTLFAALVTILAAEVSLITEAVKKFLDGEGIKYSSNVVVLVLSVIVGAGGTALVYIFLGIPFNPPNIICVALMSIAVWVGAMTGYDKVIQMIDQIKSI